MAMDILTSRQLYATMYDRRLEVPVSHFLDTYFPASFMSTAEEILFEKIPSQRKIAPFMLPNEQGKPIYKRQGETLASFKPAYTKPKDAVRPSEMIKRQPGEVTGFGIAGQGMSLDQKYNAEVIRIAEFHRNSITRLWDWMGARAILDGRVVVNYARDAGAAWPSVTVDFGRDAGHTIVLGADARWGDSGVSILDNLQSWSDTMGAAAFGGVPNRATFGALAWAAFKRDPEIRARLDTQIRGNDATNFRTGLVANSVEQPATYMGRIDHLDLWVYTGTFQGDDGSAVAVMNPKDVLLTAPGVEGVKAFGAILDNKSLEATDIFTKMWDNEDPSARFIMSQSAPLPIPVNPNRTLKARVLA